LNKVKIYLDTSVISHLDAEDTPEKMQDTHLFWQELKKGFYKAAISDLTLAELAKCPEPKRTQLYEYLGQIDYEEVEESQDSIILTEEYLSISLAGISNTL
jgi:hypothetical protein